MFLFFMGLFIVAWRWILSQSDFHRLLNTEKNPWLRIFLKKVPGCLRAARFEKQAHFLFAELTGKEGHLIDPALKAAIVPVG